jgi:SOS-response transcriptional repressor LexA
MATTKPHGRRNGESRRRLLRWLLGYMTREGRAPSWYEMMSAMGYRSPHAVAHQIDALRADGLVATLTRPAASASRCKWDRATGPQATRRTLSLPGAPMRLTSAGLVPVVDPSTPAGRALLLAISEVPS